MNKEEKYIFSIKNVIDRSIEILVKFYPTLLAFSIVSALFSFLSQQAMNLSAYADSMMMKVLFGFLGFGLFLFMIYLTMRITISMAILIKHSLNNESFSIKQAITESGTIIWNYILTTILVVLILALPSMFLFGGYLAIGSIAIKFVYILLFIGVVVYLYLRFGFAVYASIFNRNEVSLKHSTNIMKGNYLSVFLIYFIVGVLSSAAFLVGYQSIDLETFQIIKLTPVQLIVNSGLSALIMPISLSLIIVTYLLVDKKYEDDNYEYVEVEE
jgi:hypothetical protein